MSKRTQVVVLDCLLAAQVGGAAELAGGVLHWEKLPPLPNAAGLGSPYAGVSDGTLLVGGGANFPEAPPWAGGKKRWYDTVYALSGPEGSWKEVGELPRPMGYGVSVTARGGLVCAGGSDLERHYRDVFRAAACRGQARNQRCCRRCRGRWPTVAGPLLGNVLYIAGGIEEPSSTNTLRTFWALDLAAAAPAWRELEPWPGPGRMLSVAAVQGGAFYLISGTEPFRRCGGQAGAALSDGRLSVSPRLGLEADGGHPAAGGGGAFPRARAGEVAHPGPLRAMMGPSLGSSPLDQHPGFAKDVLAYNAGADIWSRVGEVP